MHCGWNRLDKDNLISNFSDNFSSKFGYMTTISIYLSYVEKSVLSKCRVNGCSNWWMAGIGGIFLALLHTQ